MRPSFRTSLRWLAPASLAALILLPSQIVGDPAFNAGNSFYGPGIVYVYDLESAEPGIPTRVLNNPSPGPADGFGSSVAVDGGRLVIGADGDTVGSAARAGTVYVYGLQGSIATGPMHTIVNPAPAVGDAFGNSLAISGSRIVVGALYDDAGFVNAGSAYVYDLSRATPTVPVTVLNSPATIGQGFGGQVTISGAVVAVGMPEEGESQRGTVFVFDLLGTTPTIPRHRISGDEPSTGLGAGVAFSGTRLIAAKWIGEILPYDLSGATPTAGVPLQPPVQMAIGRGERFGHRVAVSGARVAVGAPYEDWTFPGGVSSSTVDAGAVYIYERTSATPAAPVVMLANPDPSVDAFLAGELFGYSVAVSGSRVVVGVPFDDTSGSDAGLAYVYDLAGPTPTVPVATLRNPTPNAYETFGWDVAISGNLVAVSADADDTGAPKAGSVYVFDLNDASPQESVLTINNPLPWTGDLFGDAIALSGSRLVVGAYSDDSNAMKTRTTQGIRLALAALVLGCPSLEAAKPGGGGTIAGTSFTGRYNPKGYGIHEAYHWTPGVPNGASGAFPSLGSLGDSGSYATGTNTAGQTVGASLSLPKGWRNLSGFVPLDSTPFLWQNGSLKSVYSLLSNPTGWNRTDRATAINDSGWITGSGWFNNSTRAFLVRPR